MRLLHQLARRERCETTLTILGITIGIWALVVFSPWPTRSTPWSKAAASTSPAIPVTDASSIGVAIGTAPMNVDVADQVAAPTASRRPCLEVTHLRPEGGGAFGGGDDHRLGGWRRPGPRDR